MTRPNDANDPRWFRTVLGNFPTGVVIVTAQGQQGPVGMTVGSFTAVSLNPPLVAFLPDRNSSTFSQIREAGNFCVNVLSADQTELCRQFATKGPEKYSGVTWEPADVSGAPRLAGSLAWIDCDINAVHDAGDHYIVVGAVHALGLFDARLPLLFFQGGYGHFSAMSLAAESDFGLGPLMRQIELVRPQIEDLATATDMEAVAVTRQGNDMLIIASAGAAAVHGVPTRIGQRIPMIPPLGAVLIAWADGQVQSTWLSAIPAAGDRRGQYLALLQRVRERGWSLNLISDSYREFEDALNRTTTHSPTKQQREQLVAASARLRIQDAEPENLDNLTDLTVRNITAPVFGAADDVAFAIGLVRPQRMTTNEIEDKCMRLRAAAASMTRELAGGH